MLALPTFFLQCCFLLNLSPFPHISVIHPHPPFQTYSVAFDTVFTGMGHQPLAQPPKAGRSSVATWPYSWTHQDHQGTQNSPPLCSATLRKAENMGTTDVMALMGFEPMPSSLLDRDSNHLNYAAHSDWLKAFRKQCGKEVIWCKNRWWSQKVTDRALYGENFSWLR